jgi:NAD(P)H dehydrogenase (quinone)
MIIVTGATGKLGQTIIRKLLERIPADQIGACCRNPEKAADLRSFGVRVRRGDFEDPDSLPLAFEGVTQLLLVSSNARGRGLDAVAQHRDAIKAAKAAGAERIVYTSQMAASYSSAFLPMYDHAATEVMLHESGVAWTSLRHGFYAASGIAIMRNGLECGEFETAADGPVSWVGREDLAEADAIILTEQRGRFNGPTPPLTGSKALDFGELAMIATEIGNKPVIRKILDDDEMRFRMIAKGVPEYIVGMFIGARNGEWATVDPTLEQLVGRPATAIKDLIAQQICFN